MLSRINTCQIILNPPHFTALTLNSATHQQGMITGHLNAITDRRLRKLISVALRFGLPGPIDFKSCHRDIA